MSMLKSSNSFFHDQGGTALTTNFQKVDFGFDSKNIFLSSDSGTIEYSFDGSTTHGRLTNGEQRSMPDRSQTKIFLKGAAGGEQYRLEVY